MTERNSHVPFPEFVSTQGTLETLVCQSANGELPKFTELPSLITATDLETYTNWISMLTQHDPNHGERGTMIHVRQTDGKLIFPSNPDAGDSEACGWAVSNNRSKYVPTLNIHSHPSDICHSTAQGDMGTLIAGWKGDNCIKTGQIIATAEHNYLVIKTQDTRSEEHWYDVYNSEYNAREWDEPRLFIRDTILQSRSISTQDPQYRPLFLRAMSEDFIEGFSFEDYYEQFIDTMNLSTIYNLGFYSSNKDGAYKRLDRAAILRMLENQLTEHLFQ